MDISYSTLFYFILRCGFLEGKNQESKKTNIIYKNISLGPDMPSS